MEVPGGLLDPVLRRNLVFMYFCDGLQAEISRALQQRIVPWGVLVLSRHEALSSGSAGLQEITRNLPVYRSHYS